MSDFKVGDKVRVIEMWDEDYRTLGEEGVVTEVNQSDWGWYESTVRFETEDRDGDTELNFYDGELELVTEVDVEDDLINPSYYKAYGAEVIDITEHLNFCRGNAVKYIACAGLKNPDKELEDLEKGLWYLNREIARVKAAAK